MRNLKIIAITSPVFFKGEAERINAILTKGQAEIIHIRKPDSSVEEVEDLLKKINPGFHRQIKLHDHFELLESFDLMGIHLN